MTTEHRTSPRRRVLRRARIVLRNGHSAVDCVVLDVSDGGARLKLGHWLAVPRVFELRIEFGPSQRAELCYRGIDCAGVRFVPEAA